jgi:hypothetical protein
MHVRDQLLSSTGRLSKRAILAGIVLASVLFPVLGGSLPQGIFEASANAYQFRIGFTPRPWTGVLRASAIQKEAIALRPKSTNKNVHPAINQKDIKTHHQRIANDAISLFPEVCQNQLKNFHVRYDNPKNRGLGSKSTIILDGNVPDDEFRALFIHEFSHLIDLGCLTGSKMSGASVFRDGGEIIYRDDPSVLFYQISWKTSLKKRKDVKDSDFVSGYSSWDPFEDLAESITYYVLQQDAFLARTKTSPFLKMKYYWIGRHVFPNGIYAAEGEHVWRGVVPWDATKLAYDWRG